jgi:phosphotransacetylase
MEAESIGPILLGMAKQYINCDTGVEAEDIVNVATIAALRRRVAGFSSPKICGGSSRIMKA